MFDNIFFSYDGTNTNGAYSHGENGIQIGNQGFSHGYGSPKPTVTANVEVFNNSFVNNGLQAILLGSGSDNNVFVHSNKFIGVAELEQMGVSVKGISYTNPLTKEMSERIFSSIFDILSMDTTNVKTSQYHDQTKANISIVHENATKTIDINHIISPIMVLFSGIVGVFFIGIFFILKVII